MKFFDQNVAADWLLHGRASHSAWLALPRDCVPVPVPVTSYLARTEDLVLWIGGVEAFPCGFAFELNIRWMAPRRLLPPFVPSRGGRSGLCFGLETHEGDAVLARDGQNTQGGGPEPAPPVLVALGAHSAPGRATVDMWLWSPRAFRLTWVLEWRNQRIGETRCPFNLDWWSTSGHEACEVALGAPGGLRA
jgi:hypothetical protein